MQTFITTELLNPSSKNKNELNFDRLIDYLQTYFPNGFEINCTITVNSVEIELDNYDMELKDGDVVILMFHQGAPVGVFAIKLAVSIALSYIVSKIFAPDVPRQLATDRLSNTQSSSVYSINSKQNTAKLGEPIPIIYGNIRTYPALIEQPYYRFENNEMYLYQTMCIGQGDYIINDVLISDTNSNKIPIDSLSLYSTNPKNVVSTLQSEIRGETGFEDYTQRVREVPEVRDIEIRGTPEAKTMIMSFSGSVIQFYRYADGVIPDLSSLIVGSSITISGTRLNDGVYSVSSVDLINNNVTVSSHTFTLEPDATDNETHILSTSNIFRAQANEKIIYLSNGIAFSPVATVKYGYFTLTGTALNNGIQYFAKAVDSNYTYLKTSPVSEGTSSGTVTVSYQAKPYTAEFQTSYGEFTLNTSDSGDTSRAELDFIFPSGLYNSDASGNLSNRSVQIDINILTYASDGETLIATGTASTTITDKERSQRRFTRDVLFGTTDPTYIYRVKVERSSTTPESSDIKSNDRLVLHKLKHEEVAPSVSDWGDITLLVIKAKATNGISSQSQFQINAWVTRQDKDNDVASVLTDIYTNTTYGGRLPLADLDLTGGTELVNGAIDASTNVFDAMKMVGKSQRYTVFPSGATVTMIKDDVKPLRSYMFNETNIIKDSLKVSYLFSEEDITDSYQVKYRDPDTFIEKKEIYPTAGIYPQTLELWGCTSQATALAMATYLYKQDKARRKNIEFETDVQGLIPEFLDRIAVSHHVPSWGAVGRVLAVNGNILTTDAEVTTTDTYDLIVFIDDKGVPSSTYTASITGDGEITLTSTPPTWLYTGYDKDKTSFSLSQSSSKIRDYIVTGIKPSSSNRIKITATNYDDTIY